MPTISKKLPILSLIFLVCALVKILYRIVLKIPIVAVGLFTHELRHTWAALAIDQGANIKQVQAYCNFEIQIPKLSYQTIYGI